MRTETVPSDIVGGFPPLGSDGEVLTNAAIGAAIRARRIGSGQLLEKVSSRSGIALPLLSRIERGERSCRYFEMEALAKALDTTVEDMRRLATAIRRTRNPQPGVDAAHVGRDVAETEEVDTKSAPAKASRGKAKAHT